MKAIEDKEIISLIKAGKDKVVIPMLYKNVLPQLKNYIARNHGNKDDANDIFHDVLMVFYEQVVQNKFDLKYNIAGYLYRLSVFRWINKIKRDKTISYVEELPEMEFEDSTTFYHRDQTKEPDLLKQLFEPIGEKCLELLTHTIYSDMLMEDIMLRMGFASVDAVRMQQMRCKQKLIKEMEKNPSLLDKIKGV